MSYKIFSLLLITTQAWTYSAKEIFQKSLDREDGKSSYSQSMMLSCSFKLVNNKPKCKSAPRKKSLEGVAKDIGKDLKDDISLSIVVEPASERGMVFLQKSYDDDSKDTEQSIYMPALKKLKKIVSETDDGPKTGSLFGSEFAYEDIEKVHLNDGIYELLGEEEIQERKSFVIKSTPTEKRKPKTSYSFAKSWIDKESFVVHKVEMYDKTGVLTKTLHFRDYYQDKDIWINKMMIMINHKNQRMSMLKNVKQKINIKIDEELFSTRAVSDTAFRESKMKAIRN